MKAGELKKWTLVLLIGGILSLPLWSQSRITAYGGASLAYTNHPSVNPGDDVVSGYHVGAGGRIGKNALYFRPGIELHVMKLKAKSVYDPFVSDPDAYFIKIPLQAGWYLVRKTVLALRLGAGVQWSLAVDVEENDFFSDSEPFRKNQIGALLGAGIDLGPVSLDLNFEKGLSKTYAGENYKTDYMLVSLGFLF